MEPHSCLSLKLHQLLKESFLKLWISLTFCKIPLNSICVPCLLNPAQLKSSQSSITKILSPQLDLSVSANSFFIERSTMLSMYYTTQYTLCYIQASWSCNSKLSAGHVSGVKCLLECYVYLELNDSCYALLNSKLQPIIDLSVCCNCRYAF